MKKEIEPLTINGSRIFDTIGDLAEAMGTTRDNVNLLMAMPGFPYSPVPGRKKPIYVEYKVAEFLDSITRYKPKR
ncbi:unnamed protein product [Fructobacillus evanidus]|uniref:DNA-binding protein n=1 Tax=Fructobacillus evanidus TaxID=3064281 RepID=A0ABM9N1T9_9LACO|nr:unnamed protein product [Fructobacillus sp. LMG 32999]CAK1243599.1 unnamed protein product [Fructobacillus sp. LMG 32999]CAK1254173.1 unnamed protein product [Fructobacillus sp. LMG 32999]CAK1254671.1 unnamed protein product [Fructobacillus sp. LMG 32999]